MELAGLVMSAVALPVSVYALVTARRGALKAEARLRAARAAR